MRVLKIIGVALILIIGPVVLESCCLGPGSCGCGGEGFDQPHFNISAMDLTLYPYPQTTLPLQSPRLASVSFQVSLDVMVAMVRSASGYSAYACSPPPEIFNQKFTDIQITSDHALTTDLGTVTAGQSLNALFKVYTDYNYADPVESILNNEKLDRYVTFRSDEKARVAETHVFTIVITLDDGQTFSMQSDPVQITLG